MSYIGNDGSVIEIKGTSVLRRESNFPSMTLVEAMCLTKKAEKLKSISPLMFKEISQNDYDIYNKYIGDKIYGDIK